MTATTFDTATTPQALHNAWLRVRANAGAAGVDGQSIFSFESNASQNLDQLHSRLCSQRYTPAPLLQVQLQRPGKSARTLLIPTVVDRVVQTAVKNALQPNAEQQFSSRSYGYRPCRSVDMAIARCQAEVMHGNLWAVDADIQKFFDNIPHTQLLRCLQTSAPDADLMRLVDQWLAQSPQHFNKRGIGQGSPLSPLLSNLYLDALDKSFEAQGVPHVRYADDFVAFAASSQAAARALQLAQQTLASLGLALHPDKTQVLMPGEHLQFLGQTVALQLPASHAARSSNMQVAHAHQKAATAQCNAHSPSAAPPTANAKPAPTKAAQCTVTPSPHYRSLYLLEANTWVKRDGVRLVVTQGKVEKLALPAEQLDIVLAFGNTNFTAGALAVLLEHSVPIVHLTQHGGYLGTTDAVGSHGLALQQAQFAAAADPLRSLALARSFVTAKLKNQYIMLKRLLRRHPVEGVQSHLDALRQMRAQCHHVRSLDALRGCEGFAARSYFAALRVILPQQWQFQQRSRPAQDPINALLSLGYTLLFQNMRSLLQARGLQTQLGFLHAARPGHPALVSDMMEEFRAPVVDALVLDLCLSGSLQPHDFEHDPALGCRLQTSALKKFIHALEAKLQSPAQSANNTPLNYRQAMHLQAHSLAAHLQQRQTQYIGYRTR